MNTTKYLLPYFTAIQNKARRGRIINSMLSMCAIQLMFSAGLNRLSALNSVMTFTMFLGHDKHLLRTLITYKSLHQQWRVMEQRGRLCHWEVMIAHFFEKLISDWKVKIRQVLFYFQCWWMKIVNNYKTYYKHVTYPYSN